MLLLNSERRQIDENAHLIQLKYSEHTQRQSAQQGLLQALNSKVETSLHTKRKYQILKCWHFEATKSWSCEIKLFTFCWTRRDPLTLNFQNMCWKLIYLWNVEES